MAHSWEQVGASQFECSYSLARPDLLCAHVSFGGVPITNSPFVIDVAPRLTFPESLVRVTGAGVGVGTGSDAGADAGAQAQQLFVGSVAQFAVALRGVGSRVLLKEEIVGPSDDSVEPGSFEKLRAADSEECSYVPGQPGEYVVRVLANDEHVLGSPFVVEVCTIVLLALSPSVPFRSISIRFHLFIRHISMNAHTVGAAAA